VQSKTMEARALAVALVLALLPTPTTTWHASSSQLLSRRPLASSGLPRAGAAVAVTAAPGVNTRSDKIYDKGEFPMVLGALKAGTRKLCVVTGASSGLGLATVKALADEGSTFVIAGVRDPEKMRQVAKEAGIKDSDYCAMKLELASLKSVRDFVANLKAFKGPRRLERLVCNAAVYLPADPKPRFTDDGFEMSMGVNHLGHFLLANLLLDDMAQAKNARVCIVGSITGNTNTIGGGFVYPRADLGALEGLANPSSALMADGGNFDGAKAYKDSKLLNMMTISELHRRYHDSTGITFCSMYPGCIAETNLFREKREWFRKIFPVFMKYVTGGYVGEAEAGERLAQVVNDPRCTKSGVYWSWNGNAQQVGTMKMRKDDETGKVKGEVGGAGGAGGDIFENQWSNEVTNQAKSSKAWDLSLRAVGL